MFVFDAGAVMDRLGSNCRWKMANVCYHRHTVRWLKGWKNDAILQHGGAV